MGEITLTEAARRACDVPASGCTIVWDFDHHVCTCCRGRHAHAIGHVLVDTDKPSGDFMLRCTTCGTQDGPFAGPRQRDDHGNRLPPPG